MADESVIKTVPDPSTLTTEQLIRVTDDLKEIFEGKLDVLRERLNGIDRATKVLDETVNRVPTAIQTEISHVRQLSDEKFNSVDKQFRERDTRQERESRDNSTAVNAAFAAQKEAASEKDKSNALAISKSEAIGTEAINKLAELFKTATDALSDKIEDLKDRLARVEQSVSNINSVKQGGRDNTNSIYAAISGVSAALAIVLAVVLAVRGV